MGSNFNRPTAADLLDASSMQKYVVNNISTSEGPLRTTASLRGDLQQSVQTQDVSDILQGAFAVRDKNDVLSIINYGLSQNLESLNNTPITAFGRFFEDEHVELAQGIGDNSYTGFEPSPGGNFSVGPSTTWGGLGEVFVDDIEDLKYAHSVVLNHPNCWWGRSSYQGAMHTNDYPGSTLYSERVIAASKNYDRHAASAVRAFTSGYKSNPKAYIHDADNRAWFFPSIINFMWLALQNGFILDIWLGTIYDRHVVGRDNSGKKFSDYPEGVGVSPHTYGSAIDFGAIGHISLGSKTYHLDYGSQGSRTVARGQATFSQFTQVLERFAAFIGALPVSNRPRLVASPKPAATYGSGASEVRIGQDRNPTHIHVDYGNKTITTSGASENSIRIGYLLPQLKRK